MKVRKTLVTSAALVGLLIFVSIVSATPLSLNSSLTMSGPGLTISEGGVGLESRSFPATITVSIGGPVQTALLYWAGRDFSCVGGVDNCQTPTPYLDQEMIFAGTPILGEIIGTEQYIGRDWNNIGYRVDVTSIVQSAYNSDPGAGTYNFSVDDSNVSLNFSRFNGAGLLVVYQDQDDSASYEVLVYEGLDFAYSNARGETQVTQQLDITYPPRAADVSAELITFTGDGEADRPDTVTIDGTDYYNELSGQDGDSYDTQVFNLNIPAGTTTTSIQVKSEPNPFLDGTPDSLLWEVAALRIPTTTPTAITLSRLDITSNTLEQEPFSLALALGAGLIAAAAYTRRRHRHLR